MENYTSEELTKLDDEQFYTVFDNVLDEHTKRMSKCEVDVLLNIGDSNIVNVKVPAETLISEFKEQVEEMYFYMDKKPFPGPSARWTYELDDRKEIVDPEKTLAYYSGSDSVVSFRVSPPKKRTRVSEDEKAQKKPKLSEQEESDKVEKEKRSSEF
eukprot:TRINITY_DN7216_c0_g2_i1.p1 TRINITY_DN7216_c0_g2~~TRINITY_DN7216_c0_g2_i1.p1  ORF type:complete len:156 (-),score=43.08 TRINITY_DN7216_c0_g2_i1:39-506(-)